MSLAIVNASLGDASRRFTISITDGLISGIEPQGRIAGGRVIDADGGAVLPGLWDHHVHLRSAAARSRSIDVSGVESLEQLARVIASAPVPPSGWLRLVGYEDERMGILSSQLLDRLVPDAPSLRIQHRSGHHWALNSRARRELIRRGETPVPDDGVIWDGDDLLRVLDQGPDTTDISRVAHAWSKRGLVGVTDMTPTTTPDSTAELVKAVSSMLDLTVFGAPVGAARPSALDGVKLLLDGRTPTTLEMLLSAIASARPLPVAVHSVTAESLVLAAVALRESSPHASDRIEHAFLTPAGVPAGHKTEGWLFAVGVQPGFIYSHGSRLRRKLSSSERADYQRLRDWQRAGVRLLGGSDAPFATSDLWVSMAAAVSRRSREGAALGRAQSLTPEAAFALFTPGGLVGEPDPPVVRVGDAANLCVIDRPWSIARRDLARSVVRATLRTGRVMPRGGAFEAE